jgi:hypothetical protein
MDGRINPNSLISLQKAFSSQDARLALSASFELLDIDAERYIRMRSALQKKQALLYRFLIAEFKCRQPALAPFIDQAYQLLLTAPCTTENHHATSPYSYGLVGLQTRTVRRDTRFDQSVMTVGKKDSGVEPGFKAILKEDLFLAIHRMYPKKADRLQLYQAQDYDIEKLYTHFQASLPVRLVKLAYKDVDRQQRIVVEEDDVKRSGEIQKYFSKGKLFGAMAVIAFQMKKSVSSSNKNAEAIREVVANDIARLFMSVQSQTLYQGRYPNGLLKLMLMQELNKNAKILGPLAGDSKTGENRNYCVLPILQPVDSDETRFLSDDSISLAEHLAILLVQGDDDGIGSKGQNKMRDGKRIYGIDFGHAYQASIVSALTRDFHIKNPKFKNYSVFHDAPRSAIVRGLIKVAAVAGRKIDPRVLQSYGSEFKAEVENLMTHVKEDEKIFQDYITELSELKVGFAAGTEPSEIKRANITCCEELITMLRSTLKRHVQDRDALIEKFSFYLTLDAQAIDLMESIEKLCTPKDKITLRSPDRQVLLNHLRIDDAKRADWEMKVVNHDEQVLSGVFHSEEAATYATEMIDAMAADQRSLFTLRRNGKTVTMAFSRAQLQPLAKLFHEDKIKEKYYGEDYRLYLRYKAELTIQALTPVFNELGVAIKLTREENDNYGLEVTSLLPHELNPIFAYFLRKHLSQLSGTFSVESRAIHAFLPTTELHALQAMLSRLPQDVATIKASYDKLTVLFSKFNPYGAKAAIVLDGGDQCTVTFAPASAQGFDAMFGHFFRLQLTQLHVPFVDSAAEIKMVLDFSALASFHAALASIPDQITYVKAQYVKFDEINARFAANKELGSRLAFVLHRYHDHVELELIAPNDEKKAQDQLQISKTILGRHLGMECVENTFILRFEQLMLLNEILVSFYAACTARPKHTVLFSGQPVVQASMAKVAKPANKH